MTRTELVKGFGVFVLVVAVVLAGTMATGALLTGSPNSMASVNASTYTSNSLIPKAVDDNGTVGSPNASESKTVVIDKSHGNVVSKGTIQPLIDALVRDGHDVRFYTGGQTQGFSGMSGSNLNDTLESADAFVVVNPGSTYTEDEINGVESFTDAGGRVLMLADPVSTSQSQTLSIPNPLGGSNGNTVTPGQPTNLAARFGISFGSGYLYNMETNANNFQSIYAGSSGNSSLTSGVDRVVVRNAAPLTLNANTTSVIEAADTRLSSTRKGGEYTIAAHVGNVTTVGDTDFLSPASVTVADNEEFVTGLARFLVSGDKEPISPDTESPSSGTGEFTSPTQPGNRTTSSFQPNNSGDP